MSRQTRSKKGRTRQFLFVGILLTGLWFILSPAPAASAVPACDLIPSLPAQALCRNAGGGDTNLPILPSPGTVLQSAAHSALDGVMAQFANQEAATIAQGMTDSWNSINASTTPELTSAWFIDQYNLFLWFTGIVAAILFYTRLVDAVRKMSIIDAGNAVIAVVIYIVVSLSLPPFINRAVSIADGGITPWVINRGGDNFEHKLKEIVVGLAHHGDWGSAILLPVLTMLVGSAASLVMQFEFILREAAVYIFVILELIFLATWVSGRSSAKLKKNSFALTGLVLFKVIAAAIFLVGVHLLTAPGNSYKPAVYASIILCLLPILTWVVFKLLTKYEPSPSTWIRTLAAMTRLRG